MNVPLDRELMDHVDLSLVVNNLNKQRLAFRWENFRDNLNTITWEVRPVARIFCGVVRTSRIGTYYVIVGMIRMQVPK